MLNGSVKVCVLASSVKANVVSESQVALTGSRSTPIVLNTSLFGLTRSLVVEFLSSFFNSSVFFDVICVHFVVL